MNAALLVLTSALGAGGDVVPAGWGETPPAIIQAGGCGCATPAPSCDPCAKPKLLDKIKARLAPKCKSECDACAAPAPTCDPCAEKKIGFFDKLKAHFAKKKECAPACDACAAPAPAAPACAPAPACEPVCDPCAKQKIGLLDKIKAHWAAKKSHSCCAPACDSCAAPAVAGCATPGPVVTPPATKDAPKEMPKVKDAPKGVSLPTPPAAAPAPVTLPALPVVPSSGIKLSTPNSPY